MSSRRIGISLATVVLSVAAVVCAQAQGYPRIANLWGCPPTTLKYDMWSKYDLLVMDGAQASAWQKFRAEVTRRNPDIKLLGTAIFMNLESPKQADWMRDEWYARRPSGEMISWWAGQVYVPNITLDDCLNGILDHDATMYNDLFRAKQLDGFFFDSVIGSVTALGEIDTNRDGTADPAADINTKWRSRQNVFFDKMADRWPGSVILANDVDLSHAPHVNGRLFEGGTLLDRVANGSLSVNSAIDTLNEWTAKSRQPAITVAMASHPIGWQWWRVGKGKQVTTAGEIDRVRRDFRRMRFGLCTTLMTDAYFAYDVGTVYYGLPFWYTEYDAPLGKPLGACKEKHTVPPVTVVDWSAGRDPGVLALTAIDTPSDKGVTADISEKNDAWNCIFSTDPERLKLQPLKTYRIEAECRILRKPEKDLIFTMRTAKGGWENHDKGMQYNNVSETGGVWRIDATVTLDDFDDYSAQWHLLGNGAVRLTRLRITQIDDAYFVREFDGGSVLLNPLSRPVNVKLDRPMKRLKNADAPLHIVEIDDSDSRFSARGAWEVSGGEEHYYGNGYRMARKPGEAASWSFTAPSADTYTIYATSVGGKEMTDSAQYSIEGAGKRLTAAVDQRKCDGGWVKLFAVRLAKGQTCRVLLNSSGAGSTCADAIRAESRTRYNDGTLTRSVTLQPMDGIILLNGRGR